MRGGAGGAAGVSGGSGGPAAAAGAVPRLLSVRGASQHGRGSSASLSPAGCERGLGAIPRARGRAARAAGRALRGADRGGARGAARAGRRAAGERHVPFFLFVWSRVGAGDCAVAAQAAGLCAVHGLGGQLCGPAGGHLEHSRRAGARHELARCHMEGPSAGSAFFCLFLPAAVRGRGATICWCCASVRRRCGCGSSLRCEWR